MITRILHCYIVVYSYYSNNVGESPVSSSILSLGRHGNIKSMIECMYWVHSQEKPLKHLLATVGK